MRVYIETFGCKVNFAESSDIGSALENSDHTIVSNPADADLFIINSCSVTHRAEREIRQVARRFYNARPDARIVITGCSVLSEEFIERKGEISFATFVPTKDIKSVLCIKDDCYQDYRYNRSRPFIKIQSGCDRLCTYCIVPYLRGKPQSLPLDDIIGRVVGALEKGYQEIVLVGTHILLYRDDKSGANIFEILNRIETLNYRFRIRLSSIEPYGLDNNKIKMLSEITRLCGHLHIAIQNGSDRVLADMNRHYKRSDLIEIVRAIKEKIPEVTIGTDIIVGFPTETERDFAETVTFIESLPIDYIHVFRFSPRKNTPAYGLRQLSASSEIKRRAHLLKEISLKRQRDMISRYIGKVMEVIIINNDGGCASGLTHNYIRVMLKASGLERGRLYRVRLTGVSDTNMLSGDLYE